MSKSKARKRKDTIRVVFLAILLFLLLSIIVPAIGVFNNSPDFWVDAVEFFQSVQDHFFKFWMFYTISIPLSAFILKK